MNVLIFEMPDGSIVPVIPVAAIEPGETEEEYHAYVAGRTRRAVPTLAGGVFRAVIDEKDLPPRRFRGFTVIDPKTGSVSVSAKTAWRWNAAAKKPTVDLDAARAQLLAETRFARNAALKESDAEHARLSEIGTPAEKKSLAEKRQALRDLPASVAAKISGMTLAELEAFKPL